MIKLQLASAGSLQRGGSLEEVVPHGWHLRRSFFLQLGTPVSFHSPSLCKKSNRPPFAQAASKTTSCLQTVGVPGSFTSQCGIQKPRGPVSLPQYPDVLTPHSPRQTQTTSQLGWLAVANLGRRAKRGHLRQTSRLAGGGLTLSLPTWTRGVLCNISVVPLPPP